MLHVLYISYTSFYNTYDTYMQLYKFHTFPTNHTHPTHKITREVAATKFSPPPCHLWLHITPQNIYLPSTVLPCTSRCYTPYLYVVQSIIFLPLKVVSKATTPEMMGETHSLGVLESINGTNCGQEEAPHYHTWSTCCC